VSAEPTFSANYNLQQRLDAFVRGECNTGAFVHELFVLCDATPDSAWDALSLIDQYYRRGKLSADLFQTLKCRIERRVLGVRDSDITRELPRARAATAAAVGALRGGAVAMAGAAANANDAAANVRASRIEPFNVQRAVQRYRERIAILSDYCHRTCSAFANTQHELGVSLRQAVDYCRRLSSNARRHPVREPFKAESTGTAVTRDRIRARWPVLAALLLCVGASPALHDLLSHGGAGNVALPTTPAAVLTPQVAGPAQKIAGPAQEIAAPEQKIVAPGQISLSTDQYIVFPGHASAEIQVQRIGGAGGDVSFVWWTEGSGARPGRDYIPRTPKVAHVSDGVETLQLSVPILANPSRKHTELFYVVISKPGGGASLGSTRRAAVFIMRPD
jgi:hypothetical protein